MRFHGLDVVEVNFAAKQPLPPDTTLALDISPQVFYPEGEPLQFRLLMNLRLHADDFFTLTIKAVGYFEFDSQVTPEERKYLLNRNAPAIMFPYVRSLVTTLSASFGNSLGTLTLPVKFFAGEVPEIEALSAQKASEGKAIAALPTRTKKLNSQKKAAE